MSSRTIRKCERKRPERNRDQSRQGKRVGRFRLLAKVAQLNASREMQNCEKRIASRKIRNANESSGNVLHELVMEYNMGRIGSIRDVSKAMAKKGMKISASAVHRYMKELKRKEVQEKESPEEERKLPSLVKGRVLSRRLNETVMCIEDEGGVRQYTRSWISKDGTKEHFRCNRCFGLRRRTGEGPVPYIHVVQGMVVGNRFPQHQEQCRSVSEQAAAVKEVDRTCRKEVRLGQRCPRSAHAEGLKKILDFYTDAERKGELAEIMRTFPSWERIKRGYYRQRLLGKQVNSSAQPFTAQYCLEGDLGDTGERKLPSLVKGRALSRRLNETVMCIEDEGGVRQYTRSWISKDGTKEHFRRWIAHVEKKFAWGKDALAVPTPRYVYFLVKKNQWQRWFGLSALGEMNDVARERELGLKRILELHADGGREGERDEAVQTFPSWETVSRGYYRQRLPGNLVSRSAEPFFTPERYSFVLEGCVSDSPERYANGVLNDALRNRIPTLGATRKRWKTSPEVMAYMSPKVMACMFFFPIGILVFYGRGRQ
ncbi:unnamed protein product [Toxocara canis]|uniref:HTH_21 domain-containing protein n=1 Tax=Toxocara canis TaxID=6265 RepID=A0A183UFF7_TOXCA|nr:unnamed protein product [Toxocara canis]